MTQRLKVIFVGTPDFACPSLMALSRDTALDLCLVITQPDMPAGRGLTLKAPAVKTLAQRLKLPVSQPVKIKDISDEIKALNPDIVIVAAYSQLIPESLLVIPKFGWINVHGSLLPHYRGAGVIQAPLLAGETSTGVTIMLMNKGLDTGAILAQAKLTIAPDETAGSLSERLANLGGELLLPTINGYITGQIKPQEQDESLANYVGMIKKQDGMIDWQKPAVEIERLVRAMSPWPSAWTWLKGKKIKLISVSHRPLPLNTYKVGKTFVYNNQLAVQCGQDALLIDKLQLEGRGTSSSAEFINGHRDDIGLILG